jgi:hypothetical protein
MVDGIETTVDMQRGQRAQIVAALLNGGEVFRAIPLSGTSVTMVAENPVLLARHLATGGSLDDWPRLHLGHPHRRAGGRAAGRRQALQHGAGGTIAGEEAAEPPF